MPNEPSSRDLFHPARIAPIPMRRFCMLALLGPILLWVAQPPFRVWPVALVALVPWLWIAKQVSRIRAREFLILWVASSLYWLISLQGLRHAHPMMIFPLLALAGYLGVYAPLFVLLVRRARTISLSPAFTIAMAWVALEWIRSYFLSGISVLMLGHALADQPLLIQIADLQGTYGVSFLIVVINVGVFSIVEWKRTGRGRNEALAIGAIVATSIVLVVAYGWYRLSQPLGETAETFALIQRSEPVEYDQSRQRAVDIYRAYARQSVKSIADQIDPVDVVVWPESMFNAGQPWQISGAFSEVPAGWPNTIEQIHGGVEQFQKAFLQRARDVQQVIASANPTGRLPHLLVGCGVIRFAKDIEEYSAVVAIQPDGTFQDWYGKTHLVMFGEYIPVLPHIPGLRSLVPQNMGLTTGPGPRVFKMGQTHVMPNICIETAVERVTISQLNLLAKRGKQADVIATVTNDGWFDNTSVIDHHLRCAQMVAIGARRPILSAANNGPTAWIDSCGRVVKRLATGSEGAIIAKPSRDTRRSLYVSIGDWPVRVLSLLVLIGLAFSIGRRDRNQQGDPRGDPRG